LAKLGNAWHLPANPEPKGRAGMRDPVFPIAPSGSVTIISGNQFQGGGNPGNQLQVGSAVLFKQSQASNWTTVPMVFTAAVNNNKYYSAQIPTTGLGSGTVIQYYLRIAYDDHDTTFVQLSADGINSATTGDENAARARPFVFTLETADVRGQWGPVIQLPNVAVHSHVLPTGRVLMWGRRDRPDQSLDTDPPSPLQPNTAAAPPATCTPFIWDPTSQNVTSTPGPTHGDAAKTPANLFCSGHSFLPDGRLLVAGGHLADGAGLNQTTVYDPVNNTWTASAVMNAGRWYPTVTTLPDGSVLILAGSSRDATGKVGIPNVVPEVWSNGAVTGLNSNPDQTAFDLYPRLHVAVSGRVISTGSLAQTWSFDLTGGGTWAKLPTRRANAQRDYAPSVLYDADKVIYIGGGNAPTPNAELLDMGAATPAWQRAQPMHFARRQHNATILADGTVLVTGGTRSGGGGPPQNFNNLDLGQPVHIAELWNPADGTWTQLGAESIDRCYHSTAVLLPDGRVLSAGGGEFFPVEGITQQNDPADTHRDAQVFSPPYLFKGARPVISSAPASVGYGETFHVDSPQAGDVTKVSWIKLSSVTHSFNTGQRYNSLAFKVVGAGLDITAPASANASPPGHYMLFLLNQHGVPSVASIVRISSVSSAQHAMTAQPEVLAIGVPRPGEARPQDAFAHRARILQAATGTRVVVGITGTCPYGIAACWGGAYEGLQALQHVQYVDPIPDGIASTATVFLDNNGVPPISDWDGEFHRLVNESYVIRGFEVTVSGSVRARNGGLELSNGDFAEPLPLVPLRRKVQWDRATRLAEPASAQEAAAYATLAAELQSTGERTFSITGPLLQTDAGLQLQVRLARAG
jgi:galactose oxidase